MAVRDRISLCGLRMGARAPRPLPAPSSPLQPTPLLNPTHPPHPWAQPHSLSYFFSLFLVPGDFVGKRLFDALFFLVFLLSLPLGARSQMLLKITFGFVNIAHLHPSLDVAWATAGLGPAAPGGEVPTGARGWQGRGAQTEVWPWPFSEAGRRVGAPSGAVLPPGLGFPTFSLGFPRPGQAAWVVG